MTPEHLLNTARKEAYKMARRVRWYVPVDDMVQDAALAMLRGRDAHHGIVDGLRKWFGEGKARKRLVPLKDQYSVDPWKAVDQTLYEKERDVAINRSLAKLSAKQEVVHRLVYLDGYTYKRAAKLLGVHWSLIQQLRVRARGLLKKSLKDFHSN